MLVEIKKKELYRNIKIGNYLCVALAGYTGDFFNFKKIKEVFPKLESLHLSSKYHNKSALHKEKYHNLYMCFNITSSCTILSDDNISIKTKEEIIGLNNSLDDCREIIYLTNLTNFAKINFNIFAYKIYKLNLLSDKISNNPKISLKKSKKLLLDLRSYLRSKDFDKNNISNVHNFRILKDLKTQYKINKRIFKYNEKIKKYINDKIITDKYIDLINSIEKPEVEYKTFYDLNFPLNINSNDYLNFIFKVPYMCTFKYDKLSYSVYSDAFSTRKSFPPCILTDDKLLYTRESSNMDKLHKKLINLSYSCNLVERNFEISLSNKFIINNHQKIISLSELKNILDRQLGSLVENKNTISKLLYSWLLSVEYNNQMMKLS